MNQRFFLHVSLLHLPGTETQAPTDQTQSSAPDTTPQLSVTAGVPSVLASVFQGIPSVHAAQSVHDWLVSSPELLNSLLRVAATQLAEGIVSTTEEKPVSPQSTALPDLNGIVAAGSALEKTVDSYESPSQVGDKSS